MAETVSIVRAYKDRLFRFIFGNPEKKEWTLSLYNAINGSKYTNSNDIVINTIDDVVYMGMKNDVSFLIDNTLNLYEQQSTYNPNIPMRFLIYAGMLYSKYIEQSPSYRRFSSMQQYAPTPKCVCFYNGEKDKNDKIILKLTDGFADNTESDIELKVTMININYGHNIVFLNNCKPLEEYSFFVDKIREHQHTAATLSEAIDMALSDLPDDSVIKPFLLSNKAEVKKMCITEYDEAKTFAEQKYEGILEGVELGRKEGVELGRKEGFIEGRKDGFIDALAGLVRDGIISSSDAATRAGISVAEFEQSYL